MVKKAFLYVSVLLLALGFAFPQSAVAAVPKAPSQAEVALLYYQQTSAALLQVVLQLPGPDYQVFVNGVPARCTESSVTPGLYFCTGALPRCKDGEIKVTVNQGEDVEAKFQFSFPMGGLCNGKPPSDNDDSDRVLKSPPPEQPMPSEPPPDENPPEENPPDDFCVAEVGFCDG